MALGWCRCGARYTIASDANLKQLTEKKCETESADRSNHIVEDSYQWGLFHNDTTNF